MRTKTFLCAAVLAAGVATSMAQSNVYSLNIVGYVNFTQPASKFDIICNPLNLDGTNDVAALFPNALTGNIGLSIYKRSGSGYLNAFFSTDDGVWEGDYPMSIAPGTGFWLQTPGGNTYSNTFVGQVAIDDTNSFPSGVSLKSAAIPQTGDLTAMPGFPLGTSDGDSINFWNGASYDIFFYSADDGHWEALANPGPQSNPAVTKIPQGFWAVNQGSAKTWIRHFTVQ